MKIATYNVNSIGARLPVLLHWLASSKPDVLFIYLSMSGYEEVEIAARIAKKLPQLSVIVLSMNTSVEYILQTLHAGYVYGFSVMEMTGLPSGTVYPALRRLERRNDPSLS